MARLDLDALLNALLAFAKQMLAKRGEFHPFGASTNNEGEVSIIAPSTSNDHPEASELIELLEEGLRSAAGNGQIRAAGICLDVRLTPPGQTRISDAIHAKLEHKNGETANVFLLYRRGLLGRIKYGELFATQAAPTIFQQSKEGQK